MSLSYGCEYIDDGSYGRDEVKSKKEPWRDHPDADLVLLLPMEIVNLIADNAELYAARVKNSERIDMLRHSIRENGLEVPPLILFDESGNIRYKDGYHRLASLQDLGTFSEVPVVLKQVSGTIRGGSVKTVDHLATLFAYIAASN